MMSSIFGVVFSSPTTEDQDADAAMFSMYEGDPWEGCDDIAGEDLADFLSHQLLLKDASCKSLPSTQCSTPRGNSWAMSSKGASLPSTQCSTPRGCEDGRPSVGSFSTASTCSDLSLGFDLELHVPSTNGHYTRPSVNSFPPSPENFGFEPVAMEPLVEEEGEDDWELEFMLRSTLAAPASAKQLQQIELLAETEVSDAGDRCVALMEKCKTRMSGI